MKDPLQRQQTPYEILGLRRGSTAAEIQAAFGQGLVKRVNVQKLTGAKLALERPVDRAILDLLHYDDDVLGRLTPDPRSDPSMLEGERRLLEVGDAWEKALRRSFPDYGIAHSLAVLHYWSATDESERMGASADLAIACWRSAISYWAMTIGSEDFWEGQKIVPRDLVPKVQSALTEKLAADLHRYGQSGTHGAAFQDLELVLKNEIKTTRALAAADIRANSGRLACGVLMLQHMGLLAKVRTQIDAALERSPGTAALQSLRDALSPFGAIASLIEAKQYQAALDQIEKLPQNDRDNREVWNLESRALFERGRQETSLGNHEKAIELWKKALAKAGSEAAKRPIHDELVSTVQARAAALQSRQPDDAIRLLELALRAVQSSRLEATLGELLATRGIGTIMEAQKKVEAEKKAGPEIVTAVEKGVRDLERAAKYGSQRAKEQVSIARNILDALKNGGGALAPAGPVMSSEMASLIEEAGRAAEKKDWTKAIDALRKALHLARYDTTASNEIKKHLSMMLANRAVQGVNFVMKFMESKHEKDQNDFKMLVLALDTGLTDLREACDLDPSNSYARDNKREIEKMLSDFGPMAEAVRKAPFGGREAQPFGETKSGDGDGRHWMHTAILCLVLIVAASVATADGKATWGQVKTAVDFEKWLIAAGQYTDFGRFGFVLGKILGWPALIALLLSSLFNLWPVFGYPFGYTVGVVCGTRWLKKDGFAKLVELAILVFAFTYIPSMVMYARRPQLSQPAAQTAAQAPANATASATAPASTAASAPKPVPVAPTSTVATTTAQTQQQPSTHRPVAPAVQPPAPPSAAAASAAAPGPGPAAPAPAASQPPQAPLAPWTRDAGVSREAVLATLQRIGAAPQDSMRGVVADLSALLGPASPAARPPLLLCLGSAQERAGDAAGARITYQSLIATPPGVWRHSAEFRLAALAETSDRKEKESRYQAIATAGVGEGLFLTGGQWALSDAKTAALRALMELRSDQKSIRLFNFLRSKSFFPTPYAYLFILLALALAAKVVELPFIVQGAKMSLLVPRLRPEYERLRTRYGSDPATFLSEATQLWKRNGVNPTAGCMKLVIDVSFVVWIMLTLRNYAPQLALDGSRFLWAGNVVERNSGVLIMWAVCGFLVLLVTPQIDQRQTGQLACGALIILGAVGGAAWAWSWPAYLMIFWSVLSLLTVFVHFVTIGFLATRS